MSENIPKPVNKLLSPAINVAGGGSSSLKVNASGSATGNPRNKCALKPGYSLMGWIRLGSSGEDLTGVNGRIRNVSLEELAKHNKENDAWLAIRGKVYNVTRYMDYHPGGCEELMRGIGRDATKLFDQVHSWVNYQQLLAKCYVGPLRNVVKVDHNLFEALKPPTKPKSTSDNTDASHIFDLSIPAEITPRFDWTQKRSDITLYFYTKRYCNPGLILQRKGAPQQLEARVQIASSAHVFVIDMLEQFEFPPKDVRVSGETGKIEITLVKSKEELWTSYGAHKVSKQSAWYTANNDSEEFIYDFQIDRKVTFNHDSFAMCLRSRDVIMFVPIGLHVTIKTVMNGKSIERSYTPISKNFLPKTDGISNEFSVNFLIKSYSMNGSLTKHLLALPPSSPSPSPSSSASTESSSTLQVTPPKGNFQLENLAKFLNFAFLAAGSGLTPFLNLIEFLLKRTNNRIDQLSLLYFNKTEDDIWCRDYLETLAKTDKRFEFINILSQNSTDTWTGQKGRINKDLLSDFVTRKSSTFFAVCGPEGFNSTAKEMLQDLNCSTDQMHVFQG